MTDKATLLRIEATTCEICSNTLTKSKRLIWWKKHCSKKCGTIAWALREANKFMGRKKLETYFGWRQ